MRGFLSKARRALANITQKNVIRKKLLLYFLITAVLVNSICLYTYNNTRLLINRLNQIFINGIMLTNLSANLGEVETSLKAYLTTSHSEDLENYLHSSNELRKKAGELNVELSNDESALLLLDIKNMISTYLSYTNGAEYGKRGRNIISYSEYFNEASQVYDYINRYVDKLKMYEFQENNLSYLQLDRWLGVLQTFNVAVILAAMLVNVALIFWFSWSLTAPIIKLSRAAGEIADGNYDIPDVDVRSNDEVKTLALTFNRMAGSIRRQMVQIREKAEIEGLLREQEVQNLKMRSMLNEAQLKSLQAQINPHFMFNTLNAGMQLALFEGAERTQAFMEKLSESLRYNLGSIGKAATLAQEIANIDNYVYLLRERFGDAIGYAKRIEQGLPEVSMPRMILQPIVENAFVHGIAEKEGGGAIGLCVRREGETVRVEVADDGPGMPEALICGILDGGPAAEPAERRAGHSMGLRNVVERLTLFYGAAGAREVIEMESGAGGGTRVTLKLPVEPPEGA